MLTAMIPDDAREVTHTLMYRDPVAEWLRGRSCGFMALVSMWAEPAWTGAVKSRPRDRRCATGQPEGHRSSRAEFVQDPAPPAS